MIGTILIVVLVLILIGALPTWRHGGFGRGYWPSGGVGLLLVILIILLLLGYRV